MDDIKLPDLACAEVTVDVNDDATETDAALPFLSAASGLMLVSALRRLQVGEFGRSRLNSWRWDFRSGREMTSVGKYACQDGCSTMLPLTVRREIAQKTRWAGSRWLRVSG